MKNRIKQSFAVPVLVAALGSLLGQAPAQTFTTLHSFTAADGLRPTAGLILSSDSLYGMAHWGGSSDYGTVFAVNTDGSAFRTLHAFTAADSFFTCCGGSANTWVVNTDGAGPLAGLIVSGNTLYGTAQEGGSGGCGTVFAMNTDGTDFRTLYNFSGSDGCSPWTLLLAGTTLYGNTLQGGVGWGSGFGDGTVFAVNTDGTGFATLYNFTEASDGGGPRGALALSGMTLYGTTLQGGGSAGKGTVYKVNTDGTGFTTLHSFITDFSPTNSDGIIPRGGVILSGNTLYGTTSFGGSAGNGTVFKLNTDGTGFTVLHNFTGGDGAYPPAGLILSGSTLYGITTTLGFQYSTGGNPGIGTVFKLNTDGSGYAELYSFTGSIQAPLLLSGDTLYGTTIYGGTWGYGSIFSISLPVTAPQLTITPAGGNVILSWPTNATGFTLQSTVNLVSSALWTAVSSAPVIVSGQYTVTNPISGTQQFYRLSQ